MRLSDDIRRCVVFLGHGPEAQFVAAGTAFLFVYKDGRYIVTAKHVAAALGEDPFCIRINRTDGGSDTISVDPLIDGEKHPWFFHDEPSVDLAVMPFHKNFSGFDIRMIPEGFLADRRPDETSGIGDICYAVGLFRLVAGSKRNVPIVHTGNIALMPEDEPIPVRDWRDPSGRSTVMSQGYLIELANLPGLSGAPVFVRPSYELNMSSIFQGGDVKVSVPRKQLTLLGVWSGSWDGNEIGVSRSRLEEIRVPVGMGFVTPASLLVELLESPRVVAERDNFIASVKAKIAVQPDSAKD